MNPMDLSEEDLCRGDLFYDFVKMEPEPMSNLLPVAYMDSSPDFDSSALSDPNNNNNNNTKNNPVTSGDLLNEGMSSLVPSPPGPHPPHPSKSFIDEIFFSGSSLIMNPSGAELGGELLTGEELGRATAAGSMSLLNGFHHWSDGTTTVSSPDNNETDTHWLAQGDGTPVPTLSNLLDPIFVSYQDGDEEESPSSPGGDPKATKYYPTNQVLSSDLITSTFQLSHVHQESSSSGRDAASPQAQHHFTIFNPHPHPPDSSILLRALEGGPKGREGPLPSMVTFTRLLPPSHHHLQHQPSNTTETDMTELRKVLSYPPIRATARNHSPTSTSAMEVESIGTSAGIPLGGGFYEFRLVDQSSFNNQSPSALLLLEDETHLPNVEELIMNRVDPHHHHHHNQHSFGRGIGTGKKSPLNESTEFRIHSTTSTTTKWAFGGSDGDGAVQTTPKLIRRRKRKGIDELGPSGLGMSGVDGQCSSSGESHLSLGSPRTSTRKERSLHYCNICNKGFKDKYSVTVHIRTHTGEKPFGCSLCGKRFRQKAHLAKHYQTHSPKTTVGQGGVKGNGHRKSAPPS